MIADNKQKKSDIHYMKRALQLAKKGEGLVSPNPLVGAVIVKNNQIIGEGSHQKYGDAHAELNAIISAGQSLKDATLYSTLEPCCHTDKQTPPCVNRIIKEGIGRVVVASVDPNPKVKGEGFRLLNEAGIDVTYGILTEENEHLNKFYFKYTTTNLPYVTLKLAQSIDGYIAEKKNNQLWLTGEKSQRLVHHWRSTYDVVLVGANTLRVDNSQLTARYGKKRDPIRIVLSGSAEIDPDLDIFKQKEKDKTWIITSNETQQELSRKLDDTGCKVIGLAAGIGQRLSILSVLKYLAKQKVTSVMVEGGQEIFSQFIQSELWNELNIFVAPKILGKGVMAFNSDTNPPLFLHQTKKTGEDVLLTYLPK